MKQRESIDSIEKPKKGWLKHLGWAVPLFFLIKGLLWLIIPVLAAYYVIE